MKRAIWMILAGSLVLGSPFTTMAGMNHQPHNAKKFMGFERKEKVEVSKLPSSAEDTNQFRVRKSIQKKGVERVRVENRK